MLIRSSIFNVLALMSQCQAMKLSCFRCRAKTVLRGTYRVKGPGRCKPRSATERLIRWLKFNEAATAKILSSSLARDNLDPRLIEVELTELR
jgi:hypothetical protein